MKKVYLIVAGILISSLTITTAYAQTAITPNNLENTLENKIKIIDQMVKNEELDEKKAEEIKIELENCDATGSKKIGQKYNLQFGKKLGYGLGNGQGKRNHQNQ